MKLVLIISLICLFKANDASRIISVPNGGSWGNWGRMQNCPQGTRAVGFALKVEPSQGRGDDTALNAVSLHCRSQQGGPLSYITSTEGQWGNWGGRVTCARTHDHITAFSLRVEPSQGSGDDTAANDIRFLCTDGQVLQAGNGMGWGSWGPWSSNCPSGICGIETKVEPSQGGGDDTALNDVRLQCCP